MINHDGDLSFVPIKQYRTVHNVKYYTLKTHLHACTEKSFDMKY